MTRSFDDLPELDEFFEVDLPVTIEINAFEKLVCGDLAEADLSPVLLCLCSIDTLAAILVEYLEHFLDNLLQL